jgi:AraC-like DNA-binding protein
MELATRPPHPALAAHIRSLAGWHERVDGPVRRAELPGGRIVLVISFGPTLDVDGRRFGSFVAGLHDSPALTEHAGEGHGIQAYLTPLGARRLLGMPMGELTRQVVELEDLIGGGARELAERLATAADWRTRFALLERAIAERVMEAPPVAPELEWAWRRLHDSDGAVSIGALAAELGWSRRHLAATIREELGMSPKPLARLLRFERAVARLRAGAELPDVALDSGYYDQAHFNRDFREFAGVTPTRYRSTFVQDIRSVPA